MAIISEPDAAKFYNSRPKKRVGAGFLLFNDLGQILIVKPNYLDRWLFPSGGVEHNESPLTAALRECKEEIGFTVGNSWAAYINYLEPQPGGYDDLIQCLFTTDPLPVNFIDTIHLATDEIDDAKFVAVQELEAYVGEARALATQSYVSNRNGKQCIYLENGRVIN